MHEKTAKKNIDKGSRQTTTAMTIGIVGPNESLTQTDWYVMYAARRITIQHRGFWLEVASMASIKVELDWRFTLSDNARKEYATVFYMYKLTHAARFASTHHHTPQSPLSFFSRLFLPDSDAILEWRVPTELFCSS